MKKKVFLALAGLMACASPAAAQSVPGLATVVSACGTPPSTYTAGQNRPILQNTNGLSCGSATLTPSGTQNVNVSQVNGATVNVGTGAAGTGTQRVTTSSDSTLGLVAGSAIIGNVRIDQTTPGTTNGVQVLTGSTTAATQATAANLNATVVQSPSAASSAAIAPVPSASLEANHVIKGSTGNLYSFEVAADSTLSAAAWWIMIYNATTAPSDGSVTPIKCYAMPMGATAISAAFPFPASFSTGITIGVSTTGCFTKTASAHAFISGDAQ